MKLTFPMALALLFIGLKLGGCIDWSWWLVLLPMWAPLALWAVLISFLFAVGLVAHAIAKIAINRGR